jgi:hypothetical protein
MREIGQSLEGRIPMSKQRTSQLGPKGKVERIKQLTKIINLESCLHIYSYLLLFGQTTPAKLREITGLSKATMFRNLALLSDAGILGKVEDKSVEDKRYSLHYFISRDLMQATRGLYTPDVAKYATDKGLISLVVNWGRALEILPRDLTRLSNELIPQMAKISCQDAEDKCVAVAKMLSFRVGEAEDLKGLLEQVSKAITAFESTKSKKRRNLKKSLERPVVLSISLMAVGVEGNVLPKGAVVVQYESKPEECQS